MTAIRRRIREWWYGAHRTDHLQGVCAYHRLLHYLGRWPR